jgi:hypothetical protein
MRAEME